MAAKEREIERFKTLSNWFPVTAVLPFAMCFILTGAVLVNLNTRIGNPTEVMEYPAEPAIEGGIWFSLKVEGANVFLTTDDRKVFRWPAKLPSQEPLRPFVEYLKGRTQHEIFFAVLSKEKGLAQITSVISADQSLKYVHIRPVIRALAEAGITRYAFETRTNRLAHR